jgi:hypothetical protein
MNKNGIKTSLPKLSSLPFYRSLIEVVPTSAVAPGFLNLPVIFQTTCAIARFALEKGAVAG